MNDAAVALPRGTGVTNWGADARYLRLLDAHSGALMRLALLLTGSHHDAEDAVQDTLISVAQAWHRVRPESAYAYLRRALVHRITDGQRRHREMPTAWIEERAAPDVGLLRLEEDRAFVERVQFLPSQQRTVIVLRYYVDLPDAEIARTLRCSVSTVRSQASRALAKLRAEHLVATEGDTE